MATALLLGSTGMVGTHLLETLRTASPHLTNITTITRRQPPSSSSSSTTTVPTTTQVSAETSTWSPYISTLTPSPTIIFSSLATTRAAAGSFQSQYTLEHDLNIALAKSAKDSGAKVYVLISSSGANPNAYLNYTRMKGEIEEHIKQLDFEHTVILRPGLIAGRREETRMAEGALRGVAKVAGMVSDSLKDFWAQDSEVIARAAVGEGLRVLREGGEKVVIMDQAVIVRVGRTEWKGL